MQAKVRETRIENLYRYHLQDFLAYTRARGVSRDDAEEIVQDAFARMNNYDQLEKVENDTAFLRTVIINIIRDRLRKRKVTPAFITYDDLTVEIATDAPSADDKVCARQILHQTMKDLGSLPKRTKEIFLLYRLKDKTYAQIARHYNVSISVVRRHLRDAIMHLMQKCCERELAISLP
ncbi:RNA polymerase sigma factor [Kordiimonas sediminis]|uniref:RNA polymerase sigma factor n=1 Tax=Kordiimonas sediminis TaxID=1735581 RepID=A0A919AK69_9PROT|nr:RNA polymerase sigma factor [Kordiimonas sediminis]GHF13355.1 RNA polymerase sigma factor [Kordiimonas sediminis]